MHAVVRNAVAAPGHLVIGLEHEQSISGSHEHVAGVWTSTNEYVRRDDVLHSIALGEGWWTIEDGHRVALRRVTHCPWPGCSLIPYLFVAGDGSTANSGRR